jgi:hypothetical protein
MAEIIPSLNKRTLSRMTAGEKRVARCLESLLDDSYVVWYDIPVGKRRRYPDFIVLHPSRGLLFLEVKDWKAEHLKGMTKTDVSLLTDRGLVTKPHPLEQVRQYAFAVVNTLSRDPRLCHAEGAHKGQLIFPYGLGVVFTNVVREQMERGIPDEHRATLLPDHLTLYKDDISEKTEAERFQKQLWDMFQYHFGSQLSLPQIDRIRWHLFPEIRIEAPLQGNIFGVGEEEATEAAPLSQAVPDMIKVMDLAQEQLARSLGEGHRVIHGVAGSGKTMILGYRCLYLAQLHSKPILVLCFNVTLAAKLRSFIASKGIGSQVQVYSFHDWCGQQLKTYHVKVHDSGKPYFERQVEAVIDGVEKGHIPRAQYGAVLIDEGHDFQAEWLKLVVQMVDKDSDSLLLLYDDAQSIYKKRAGLGFSLASVGIQAQGRTTVLRLNYRNTREILAFAYSFVRHYLDPKQATEDAVIVEPEAAGNSGPAPVVRSFRSVEEEIEFACACLMAWHQQGVPWNHMAVIYAEGSQGRRMAEALGKHHVPHAWLGTKEYKSAYNPASEQVAVMTIYSSKGLEFPRVIMLGVGQLDDSEEHQEREARVLYVGMTRAQECLLISTSADNEYSRRLKAVA